jgi:DNA-binding sugar fermentation-stimulating protein
MTDLYTLPQLFKATVVNRPSKTIKSPYVADILLEDGSVALCHTPGLSCSGLVVPQRCVYVSKAASAKAKTAYTVQISESVDSEGTHYIGIHPMVSQMIASKLLNKICETAVWKSEVKVNDHTRLDFVGLCSDNNKKIYVEVKNAMISLSKETRVSRRATFPEGYRKSKTESFSPRAVKHAETLAELACLPDTEAVYLVFIVPRSDCNDGLELNPADQVYCRAVSKAIEAGLKVRVFGLDFSKTGIINFNKELAFHLPALTSSS